MDWQERPKHARSQPTQVSSTSLSLAEISPSILPTSEWNFSTNFGAPTWPQSYPETQISTFSTGMDFGCSGANEWNTFDAMFRNANTWEEWDDPEANSAGVTESSTRPSYSAPVASLGLRGSGEKSVLTSPTGHGSLMNTRTHELNQMHQSDLVHQPARWSTGVVLPTAHSSSFSGPLSPPLMSTEFLFSSTPQSAESSAGQPSRRRRSKFNRRSRPNSLAQRSPSTIKSPPVLPLILSTRYRTNSSPTTGQYPTPASMTSTASPTRPPKRQERSQTEYKYRNNLNNHFNTLLEALPKELVEGADGRIHSGKAVSKIEVLDLAQKRILELEMEQAELKEESAVLQGQATLFKRVLLTAGGQVPP